ncbi:MAG: flagellar basal body-associated FliL family protein [bacterium]|nr:flagellar basal body-associated FliL family protein [bacterium]
MEDELEQEGMEDEVGEPSKSSKKGSPLKLIIIAVVLVVVAVVAVFGFIMPTFFGEPSEEEVVEEEPIDQVRTEYGVEFVMVAQTISMWDETKLRVRNLVVDVTFETTGGGVGELTKRTGQLDDIVAKIIRSYEFTTLLNPAFQDSLKKMITTEVNRHLPDPENNVYQTFIRIVTQ